MGEPSVVGMEIELEPTVVGDIETWNSNASSGGTIWDRELTTSMRENLTVLLHERLRAAAGFLAIAFVVFWVFSLSAADSTYGKAGTSLALRLLVSGIVYGALVGPWKWSYWQLRGMEYFLFGGQMLLLLWGQYDVNIHNVNQGEIAQMIAQEKNGVMRTMMLMFIYAVFIPNKAKMTSRVVLTMALATTLMLAAVLKHEVDVNAGVNEQLATLNLGSNITFLLLGAALSIYCSKVLHGLRTELHEAKKLGQYQLIEKLGAGGMGEVYLAEHQLLKRPCALKLISPELQTNPIAAARFEREVQSAAMLSHPNTIEIYDYGRADDGTFYYVMEYLPGLSIADLVKEAGPLPPGRAVYLLRQACGSLAEAHRMGLVHRDIKPANILVAILGGQCDVAKILDFGLVKLNDSPTTATLTAEFTVSGTPSYMSPEQAAGLHEVDGRSDLYALGAVLYYMLTGKPPFERPNPMALMIAHAAEPVVPPRQLRPDIPADLEAVTLRCLAKKPDERYADASALSVALGKCGSASEWDQAHAEQWWLEHAAKQPQPTQEEADLLPTYNMA